MQKEPEEINKIPTPLVPVNNNLVIKPMWLLIIQTFFIFAQIVNVQLALLKDVPSWVSLIVVAFVGALTFLTQHLGNIQMPPQPPTVIVETK